MTKRFSALLSALVLTALFALSVTTNPINATEEPDPTPIAEPDLRIVGGTLADENEYPWQAALVAGGLFCGGSLISADWVLSAAHCFVNSNGNQTKFPGNFSVILGSNTISQGVRRSVAEVILHPGYNFRTQENDIALIRLTTAAQLTCDLNTIRYATPADSGKFSGGSPSTVTGWGDVFEGENRGTNSLREVDISVISNAACRGVYGNFLKDTMMCAGLPSGGKDSCQGDSGGPLIVPDGNGTFVQAGIVSWGVGCARPGLYGVYTRVSSYTGWIDGHLKSTRQTADFSNASVAFAPVSQDVSQLAETLYLPFMSNPLVPGTKCN